MAYSAVVYPDQAAGQATYQLSFAGPLPGYLAPDHIILYRDTIKQEGGFTFNTTNSVELSTPTQAGEHIMFRRETPKVTPLVDFEAGSILTDVDLDLSAIQALFIVHELLDGFIDLGTVGWMDLRDRRIINMADGLTTYEAVNLGQLNAVEAKLQEQQDAIYVAQTALSDLLLGHLDEAVANALDSAERAKASEIIALAQADIATAEAVIAGEYANIAQLHSGEVGGGLTAYRLYILQSF